jgi:hypothetical protein
MREQYRGEQGPQITESKCSGCGIELAGGTAGRPAMFDEPYFLFVEICVTSFEFFLQEALFVGSIE